MNKTISIYLLSLFLFAIGCSTSKKSIVNTDLDNNYTITWNDSQKGKLQEKELLINVKAYATESSKYKKLIDNQFKELEKLELGYAKIFYNRDDEEKYDCEIDLLFDELIIHDDESINNKSFSKKVRDEVVTASESETYGTTTVNGYVRQTKTIRKLNWNITMKTHSDSNNCKLYNNSFTENLISKSVNNSLSGDERAISKKYKDPIGQPLVSKTDMIHEVINRVYKNLETQLKSKQ